MMIETSNLLEYDATLLSLLIESIDKHIQELQATTAFTNMIIETENQINERFEIRLRQQMSNRNRKIEDLYGLRVAVLNAHQIVLRRERMINS